MIRVDDREFVNFLEDIGIYASMLARYGGVLIVYPTETEVRVLFAKNEKYLKEAINRIKHEAVWLNEELLKKEMMEYAGDNIKKSE